MLDQIPSSIQNEVSKQLNCKLINFDFVSGGCINSAGRIQTSKGEFFLKWNFAEKYPNMFQAEAEGLKLLRKNSLLRIPAVATVGVAGSFQFIILEFIHQSEPSPAYWDLLGEQLASLHTCTAPHFGLTFNNYIGSLPQRNTQHETWLSFFIHERLKPQVELALKMKNLDVRITSKFDELYQKLPDLIVEETPSLLHGDLWSGNLIVDEKGIPCLIDPAVFYGNREAEIAFTRLFGGFANKFYDCYHANFPLENGFETRADLYNLYPLLVHVNLFGGGYSNQVVSILRNYV